MSARARTVVFIALGCVLVALIAGGWLATFERKSVTRHLPPTGEARTNPVYGLKTALRASGQRVDARPTLALATHPLGARDTLLLLGNTSATPARDADAVMDWVLRGGHLIVLLDDADARRALAGRVPVQAKTIESQDSDCLDAFDDKQPDEVLWMFCPNRFTVLQGHAVTAAWKDADGHAFARLPHGNGSIDVVANQIFTARSLQNEVPSAFARQLLAPNWNAGTFHLVYSADVPPLWRLLAEHAWMILVPLALALSGWLWRRMQRFGPLLPSPEAERRSLLEHVQASGQHLHRYGRSYLLHSALRQRVLARLRRRDPVAAALEGSTQAAVVALRTGLPASHVAEALQAPRPYDDKDFRHRIARLIALGRHL